MAKKTTKKNTLTPEQKKERMDKIERQLTDGVQNLLTSDEYMKYLRTMAKFHDYSSRNCLLLQLQMPDVTYVAGFKTWQTKFNRRVKKGERGLQILAGAPRKKEIDYEDPLTGEQKKKEVHWTTYFPTYVWDISQTEGDPLPNGGVKELQGYEGTMLLSKIISASPIPVIWEDISGGAKGYYHRGTDDIHLKIGMSQNQTLKTLVHEIAHSIMHRDDSPLANEGRQEKEVQAESVAYVVCNYFGIDTSDYSFGYIAGWGGGKDTKKLFDSLESIRRTADALIDNIEKASPADPMKMGELTACLL